MLHIDIPHGLARLAGGVERQTRLARAGWPDQGDQARAAPRFRKILSLLDTADEPGRGARKTRARRRAIRACTGWDVERRILREHRLLHALQRRAGLHAELLDEERTRLGVHVECLRLAAGAIERKHQQLPAMLAIRLLADQLAGGCDEVVRALDEQLRAKEELSRSLDDLLEAAGFDLTLGDVVELRQGTPSAELQRVAKHRNRGGRVGRRDIPRDAEQPLELSDVGGRVEAVAVRRSRYLDTESTESQHVGGDGVPRRGRGVLPPGSGLECIP